MDKRGVIYALVSSATFGLITLFTIPIIKSGLLNIISILLYRLLFATVGIGILALLRGEKFKLTRGDIPKIFLLGIFYSATSLFLLFAYTTTPNDSGIYTAMHYLYPVVVMLIMTTIFRENFSYKVILSALMAIIGVAMMTVKGGDISNIDSILGVLYVLISVVTYGIYIVGANRIGVKHISPIVLTFYVLLTGTLTVMGYGVATNSILPLVDTEIIINLSLLAIICTVISNLTLILAVNRIGSTVTSILGSLEPLVAVIVGISIFGESITAMGYIGIFVIIASAVLAIKRDVRK